MPLKLKQGDEGYWHVQGTVHGRRVRESTRTRIKKEAEAYRVKLEGDLFSRAVYGDKSVATFAEAAVGYLEADGEGEYLDPILAHFGNWKLQDISQLDIDRFANGREIKPSTKIRQIYTPMTAVFTYAAENGLCDLRKIRKPEVRVTRTDYLRPDEAEAWVDALPPHLSQLVIFYLATGCRASEALNLQWKDISDEGERAVLWETKGGYSRGVDLPVRAKAALPKRHDLWFERLDKDGKLEKINPVFLTSRKMPWGAYNALNRAFTNLSGNQAALTPIHCHLLRHTWATWAYACTRDLTFVMAQGGWRSLALLGRYTHAASPDLARSVLAKGWTFGGHEVVRVQDLP